MKRKISALITATLILVSAGCSQVNDASLKTTTESVSTTIATAESNAIVENEISDKEETAATTNATTTTTTTTTSTTTTAAVTTTTTAAATTATAVTTTTATTGAVASTTVGKTTVTTTGNTTTTTKATVTENDIPEKTTAVSESVVMVETENSDKEPETDENSITAMEVAKEMGIGLNLGNTMEAYNAGDCEKIEYTWMPTVGSNTPSDYERCWGAPVTTQEMIDGIKAAGFDTIRIPVYWGNMMVNDGTYTIHPDYMARVREIVDYAQNADLYTVINIHHFDEFVIRRNSVEDCEKIFTNLWTQIAEEFKDYPSTLIFEGYNEYLGGAQFDTNGKLTDLSEADGYKLTNAMNQTFVDAVRATGGNNAERVLIISGYNTNVDHTSNERFIIPDDTAKDKLMVSVHYVDNAMYWCNLIGGQQWLDYTEDQCERLKKAFTDKGIPVFFGETTGMYSEHNFVENATYTTSAECLEIILNTMDDYGFVPVLWDTNDNFYDRIKCQIKDDSNRTVIEKLTRE